MKNIVVSITLEKDKKWANHGLFLFILVLYKQHFTEKV